MAKIYLLLPVHNRKEITRSFVVCLKNQTFSDFKLVLIDDGSSDGTAEMVLRYLPESVVLRGTGNWWWAGCLQRGLDWLNEHRVSDSALILFINDDVEFANDYLERANRVMATKRGVLLLSRYLNPQTGEISESGVSADSRKMTFTEALSSEQINCLSTRGLFVRWQDVRRIGRFHPTILPHYLSDYEYTMRASRLGLALETSAEIYLIANEQTTGFHVICENRFGEFLRKYFSIKSPGNPVYWSSFVMLTCSPVWMAVNLAKIWVRTIRDLSNAFFSSVASCKRP